MLDNVSFGTTSAAQVVARLASGATITGQIDVVVNGERRAANLIGFAKGIRHFDDDMLEQATLLTVAKVWRDDFKPRLHKALYTAFYEMREREGGFIELPEDDEPEMEIEST